MTDALSRATLTSVNGAGIAGMTLPADDAPALAPRGPGGVLLSPPGQPPAKPGRKAGLRRGVLARLTGARGGARRVPAGSARPRRTLARGLSHAQPALTARKQSEQ